MVVGFIIAGCCIILLVIIVLVWSSCQDIDPSVKYDKELSSLNWERGRIISQINHNQEMDIAQWTRRDASIKKVNDLHNQIFLRKEQMAAEKNYINQIRDYILKPEK